MQEELPGGYAGKILRVDLSQNRTWTEAWTAEMCRTCIGGVGLGIKILWDEVAAEVGWDHEDNRLVLATGPLAGLPAWGTGGLTVVTRGALTNGATNTQANGFFGANLKYSGYDAIVLQGRAPEWVYLYIHDDTVELRDASDLLGKDTWETQEALEQMLDLTGHQLSVYTSGLAGENQVRFAAIHGDYGHVASKNGCGAVMGNKRLKAVAIVRGSKALRAADPRGLWMAAQEIAEDLQYDPSTRVTVRIWHAARRLWAVAARRAADQELHHQRRSRRRGHEPMDGAGSARGIRPSRPPMQLVRHAPLPRAGIAFRPAPGRHR